MINYEWDVEIMEGEDIVDHHFCRSYQEALADAKENAHSEVVLVRSDETWHGDDRMWAYFVNGVTKGFRDSVGTVRMQVPARYLKEVARAHA